MISSPIADNIFTIKVYPCRCLDINSSIDEHPCDLLSQLQTIIKHKEKENIIIVKLILKEFFFEIKEFYKNLNVCYLYRKNNNFPFIGDSPVLHDYQRDSFVKLLISEYLEDLKNPLSSHILKNTNIVIYLNRTRYQYAHLYLKKFINYSEKTIVLLPYWDNKKLINFN